MTERWSKLGLVFAAPGTPLMRSHAMLPTPFVLPDRIRVLFASCDADLRGRVFRVDLSRDDPRQIIERDPMPVLDLGAAGAFDADGVNPSQIVARDGKLFLYYIGWQRISPEIPYRLLAGLAVSDDFGCSFQRISASPILPPIEGEELFRTAPHVFRHTKGWGMLYIGGAEFFAGAVGKRLPTYSLCHSVSPDGVQWHGHAARPLLQPDRSRGEIGFGRPVVWHDEHGPVLMLSVRTETGYRLVTYDGGCAPDRWAAVLEATSEAWDAAMTCFGAPCRVGEVEYLFYNGNQFGRSGFGVARRPARNKPVGVGMDLIAALRIESNESVKQ